MAPASIAELPLHWCQHRIPPPLDRHQIHLWLLDSTPLADTGEDGLSRAEIERAQRLQNRQRRALYIVSRRVLRVLLGHYADMEPADIAFVYGRRGKPALPAGMVEFNYAVSGGYALYAFSRRMPLGVDLEVFPRRVAAARLARRILSRQERAQWARLPESEHNRAMLACWTRKEAYGKLFGLGIRYAMNRTNLLTDPTSARWSVPPQHRFDHAPQQPAMLHGIQLGLPAPGAAALMYGEYEDRGGARPQAPEMRAFTWQH